MDVSQAAGTRHQVTLSQWVLIILRGKTVVAVAASDHDLNRVE